MPNDEQDWSKVFAWLRQLQEPEVGGRGEMPRELREKLQKFAQGQIRGEEIRQLCQEIANSSEALETLARLLNQPEDNGETRQEK